MKKFSITLTVFQGIKTEKVHKQIREPSIIQAIYAVFNYSVLWCVESLPSPSADFEIKEISIVEEE